MQPFGPAPTRHGAAGELVDDDDLALADDVVDVALEQRVGAQRRVDVVHQHDVGGVVEALALGEQAELGEHGLDLLVAVLAEVDLARLLVDGEVAGSEVRLAFFVGDRVLAGQLAGMIRSIFLYRSELPSDGPEMISGVRASSIRIESTSSTMA
jgi:hypothetical protein